MEPADTAISNPSQLQVLPRLYIWYTPCENLCSLGSSWGYHDGLLMAVWPGSMMGDLWGCLSSAHAGWPGAWLFHGRRMADHGQHVRYMRCRRL